MRRVLRVALGVMGGVSGKFEFEFLDVVCLLVVNEKNKN